MREGGEEMWHCVSLGEGGREGGEGGREGGGRERGEREGERGEGGREGRGREREGERGEGEGGREGGGREGDMTVYLQVLLGWFRAGSVDHTHSDSQVIR